MRDGFTNGAEVLGLEVDIAIGFFNTALDLPLMSCPLDDRSSLDLHFV